MNRLTTVFLAMVTFTAGTGFGQSTREQIAELNSARSRRGSASTAWQRAAIASKLRKPINVDLERSEAKEAFPWWASKAGVSLVINWNALENEGIDPGTPLTLRVNGLPSGQALTLLMQQLEIDGVRLRHTITPWYVRVLTKEQVDRKTILHIYDIRDLLQRVPNFTEVPRFDLDQALARSSSGGRGGGRRSSGGRSGGNSEAGLFGDNAFEDEDEMPLTELNRAEELAQLIRDTIEPSIWQANGGQFSSIRYHRGHLIINAPAYVHEHIGVPVTKRAYRAIHQRSRARRSTTTRKFPVRRRRSHGATSRRVSGIDPG